MLTRKTRYAMMALSTLAKSYGKGPVSMSSIASSKNIPLRFLEGILLELKKAGFLDSTRGIEGGYFLNRPPTEISLLDILKVTEGSMSFVSCQEGCGTEKCEFGWDMSTCGIRRVIFPICSEIEERFAARNLLDISF